MSTIDNKTKLDNPFKIEPLTTDSITIGPLESTTIGAIGSDTFSTIDFSSSTLNYSNTPSYTINNSVLPNTIWTTTTTGTGSGYNWSGVGGVNNGTMIGAGGKMSLNGADADVDINGKSLKNWMEKVEERLNILTPNPELEKDWDDLRKLGERYRKLEKKCKEKAEVWKKLKEMPPPKVD